MHLPAVRRALAVQQPWLPFALLKAFTEAKARTLSGQLRDTAVTKINRPLVEERDREARAQMGDDYWSYGLEPNRHVLDTFLRHDHAQGLSARRGEPEELFGPGTLDTYKIWPCIAIHSRARTPAARCGLTQSITIAA